MQSNFGYILLLIGSSSLGFYMSSQEQKYTVEVLCGGSFNKMHISCHCIGHHLIPDTFEYLYP